MEKGHLEIILEDINGKFTLVLEGHQVLHNEIKRTREELTDKIEDNSIAIRFLNKKIDKLDVKVERINGDLSGKIDKLDVKVDRVKEDLSGKIDKLDVKVDRINGDLSGKIDKLDAKVERINGDLSGKIDKLDVKVDRVNDNLGAKIDAVAVDLKCHREDTEIHTNYRVSEGKN